MPELSFVTINFNGLADTTALIRSLQSVVHSVRWELVVVDNASAGNDVFALQTIFAADPRVRIIQASRNLGFAGGNNLGIAAAKAPCIMLINNDTLVETDHFRQLTDRIQCDTSIGIISPKIRYATPGRFIQYAGFTDLTPVTLRNAAIGHGEPDNGQHDTPRPTAFAHGAAMLFTRHTLDAAGPMTEQYFLYYEEMDWSMQVRRAGLTIWYDPVQTVFHRESRTTGANSPLRAYYMTRNRLLFARRNRRQPTRALAMAYVSAVALLRDVPRHLLTRHTSLAAATLRGLRDFWCGNLHQPLPQHHQQPLQSPTSPAANPTP
ncbi:MAG: glycosyltransferase family 2 protein [Bacteroidaceae bacterium]|nr:glycosyltransferase family 2 protein [Bacteroidaceae bacterium]